MDYTNLGISGLKVSRIALGCMSFGTPPDVMPWTLDEDAAQPIFRHALDLQLADDEIGALQEHYTPRLPTDFN